MRVADAQLLIDTAAEVNKVALLFVAHRFAHWFQQNMSRVAPKVDQIWDEQLFGLGSTSVGDCFESCWRLIVPFAMCRMTRPYRRAFCFLTPSVFVFAPPSTKCHREAVADRAQNHQKNRVENRRAVRAKAAPRSRSRCPSTLIYEPKRSRRSRRRFARHRRSFAMLFAFCSFNASSLWMLTKLVQ